MMRMVNLLKIYSQVYKSYKTMFKNVFRLFDVTVWPTIQFFAFTLFIGYFSKNDPAVFGVVLVGLMGWRVFHHMHLEMVSSFMDEYWSGSLAHMIISPISRTEYVIGSAISGIVKSLFVIALYTVLAGLIYGQWFGIEQVPGIALGLVMIAGFGIATGMITLGFSYIYNEDVYTSAIVLPDIMVLLSGVYYPITIFPDALQWFARILPSTYGFEALRGNAGGLILGAGLLILWIAIAGVSLGWFYNRARKNGRLAKLG